MSDTPANPQEKDKNASMSFAQRKNGQRTLSTKSLHGKSQMSNEEIYMKRCSTSPVMREMQSKTIMRIHSSLLRLVNIRRMVLTLKK